MGRNCKYKQVGDVRTAWNSFKMELRFKRLSEDFKISSGKTTVVPSEYTEGGGCMSIFSVIRTLL